MFKTANRFPALALLLLIAAPRAIAYVDLAPTLSRIVRDADTAALVEVEKFNREKGAVILKKVRDLKGKPSDEAIKHQICRPPETAVPQHVLEWAEPGRRGVLFVTGKTALVCIGRGWYQVEAGEDKWWSLGRDRPDLPLGYYGAVSRLADAVERMVAGKTVVITTVPHGAGDEGASFDLALHRTSLPGLMRVQRIKANLRMPTVVMAVANNPAYFVGAGPAGDDELPGLIEKLASTDATTQSEAADDLRSLGPKASSAIPALTKLLESHNPAVRISAAAALLRIAPENSRPLKVLEQSLNDPSVSTRRHAAQGAGLAGRSAAPLAAKLAQLLADSDEIVRVAALQSIATLGSDAAAAFEGVTRLLEEPAAASDAADALGRIGPAARPALARLAEFLTGESVPMRWAACRAMAQIGGPEATPAVDFMIGELKNFSEVDGYNMMIYLGLLGPVAIDAIPTLETLRIKNQPLKLIAMWAIEPEKRFPWLGGDQRTGMRMVEAEFAKWIFESFLHELGDRFRPASAALAKKIMDGTAGEVPLWAYHVFARFPAEALEVITPGLTDKELAQRERATVALGYMGRAAAGTQPLVARALTQAANEREQRLIKWCLGQIAPVAVKSGAEVPGQVRARDE